MIVLFMFGLLTGVSFIGMINTTGETHKKWQTAFITFSISLILLSIAVISGEDFGDLLKNW